MPDPFSCQAEDIYMKEEKNDLIYLYCLTNKTPEIKEAKNLVANLYFIYQHGLYAVIDKVSEDEFNKENLEKNLSDVEWVRERVLIHERVIERIMRDTCLIPFKFATLFTHEDNVRACLEKNAEEFRERLFHLEGKEEWGIKIYCNREKLKENISHEDEEFLTIHKKINSCRPGMAFFLKKRTEELLNTSVNNKINRYGQESYERLRGESTQTCINKLLPKEITERKDDMILNSAFLIDKDKVNVFATTVDLLQAQYRSAGFSFDCTGPWPPYNFC